MPAIVVLGHLCISRGQLLIRQDCSLCVHLDLEKRRRYSQDNRHLSANWTRHRPRPVADNVHVRLLLDGKRTVHTSITVLSCIIAKHSFCIVFADVPQETRDSKSRTRLFGKIDQLFSEESYLHSAHY